MRNLREALPDEYEQVGALTLRAYHDGDALGPTVSPYAEELLAAARRAREAQLLVVDDPAAPGGLVATVTVCRPGSPWAEIARAGEIELRMLAVAPEHRGRGVAGEILRRLREQAHREGAVLVVSVIEKNPPAHALYRGLGFVRQPERDWWPNPQVALQVYRDGEPAAGPAQSQVRNACR